jgi:putative ABC transport system substrate-binding protein
LWLQPRSGIFEPFIRALAELGYVEGQNLVVDFREVTLPQLPALAADLVLRNVDVIVAQATVATRAAMEATRTIPIVMVGAADPVATGLVSSLHHPGGNVTGSTDMRPALTAKRVEILKEIAPFATRLAALFNPTEPAVEQEWVDTENAARAVGLAPVRIEVRAPDEIERAFALLQKEGATILVVFARVFSLTHRNRIIDLARVHKIPAVGSGGFARAGLLAGLGANYPDLLRRSAMLVDRILKGARPADLPVEQPTTFELVINLKTARALGLTIPPSLLLRADQVIE